MIMEELALKPTYRTVVGPARAYAEKLQSCKDENSICPVVAIELEDGTVVTGKTTTVMDAAAAAVLNAIKVLANIADDIHLLSPAVLNPIIDLKKKNLGYKNPVLDCEEVLIALGISAAFNPTAQVALDKLSQLKGCEAHSTVILSGSDEDTYRNLGIEITADPEFASESLFYNN